MDSFKFDKTWLDAIIGLPNDVRLEIYDSIVSYAFGGNPEGLKPMARIAFSFIKQDIDKQIKNYEAICERNRRNGSKGGRPLKNPNNPVGFVELLDSENSNNPVGFSEVTDNKQDKAFDEGKKNPNNPVGFLGFSGFSKEEERTEKERNAPTPPKEKNKEKKEEEVPPFISPKGETQQKPSTKKKPIIIPDFVGEDYRNIFGEWLEYKRAKQQTYKDDKSLQKLYTRLLNLSDNNPTKAAAIVDQSMAFNYQGLFPLKDDYQQKLKDDGVDWDKMVARFNRLGIIKVKEMDEERKQMFLRIMAEYGDSFRDVIVSVYKKIENSNYLKGFNKSGWTANYEFVFTRVNFRKIHEGYYDNMK